MEENFSQPQRQSAIGIIILAMNAIQRIIRAIALPFVVFIVKADRQVLIYLSIGAGVLIILALIYAYFSYLKFTFFLNQQKQEFVINKGVFNRTLLTIPLEKIQQVNINQSLLQKLVGVYSLQIDTPGSDKKEVSITAISEHVAYDLKAHLLNGKQAALTEDHSIEYRAETPKTTFLKLSPSTLLKVGLTSNYGSSLALLTGFVYALFYNAKELLGTFDTDRGQVESAIKTGLSFFSLGILIAMALLILLAINIIRTFVKYFDFEITQHQRSMAISSGLLAKKNTLLSAQKVQITTYSQNFFQRKFNLLNLNLKQAHSGKAEEEKDLKKANLEVPGCSPQERDTILKLILGDLPHEAATFKPDYRFLNLPIVFNVLLPLVIFLICWLNIETLKPYYPLAIAYVMVVVTMIYISYRHHQLKVNQQIIIKKSGIWDVSFEHLFPHKIQAITTFQYPWHKSVDVGHVNLHTAAGTIRFKYGNYTEIKQLVNYWLYQIESGSEEWM